jgi:hypothetical protein
VPLDDLPDWLPAWCVDQLGERPVDVVFERRSISAVYGLRLAGGREVVVKAREDGGRAAVGVEAQARLAERDPGLWPAIAVLDERDQGAVPPFVVETASRARRRLPAADLPCVLGHADFEAQNLRWRDGEVWAVHDWDSLAWQPEAGLVGAACGTFASDSPPTLAPVSSSAAFLTAYQDLRGRRFSAEEQAVAWAASLWPAAHNARWEALYGDPPVCGDALRAQAAERLWRADA